jgi:hypothetical protein
MEQQDLNRRRITYNTQDNKEERRPGRENKHTQPQEPPKTKYV